MSQSAAPEPAAPKAPSLLRSGLVVSVMTLLSRVLGMVRDIVVAAYFGSQSEADAFFIAFKIPNFLRRLFAEGAFAQAFVPVLSEYRTKFTLFEVRQLVDRVTGTLGLTLAGITAQIGYKRRPGKYGGKPSVVVDNTLDRQFDVEAPDTVWVTDITYIRTQEGFAYLAVVIDLFSRRVVGWSMQSRQTTDIVLQALLMATWRRKPKAKVLIHSDQGSQFTSMDWAAFLKAHDLEHSMSRRGNCHDNAVAESFFNLLKRERIRRRTYRTREEARRDVFDYIEMFYNPKRKHARNGMLSPLEFERQQKLRHEGV
jgi:putative transposase